MSKTVVYLPNVSFRQRHRRRRGGCCERLVCVSSVWKNNSSWQSHKTRFINSLATSHIYNSYIHCWFLFSHDLTTIVLKVGIRSIDYATHLSYMRFIIVCIQCYATSAVVLSKVGKKYCKLCPVVASLSIETVGRLKSGHFVIIDTQRASKIHQYFL